MTPKEKADSLVYDFNNCLPDLFLSEERSIYCALECIKQIEDALTNYGAMSGELQNMDSEWRYWDQVKQELNKL